MITLTATERQAEARVDGKVTTGSVGLPVNVVLSDDFDGLAVTVVFRAGEVERDRLYTGRRVTVPPECLAQSGIALMLGVYAEDEAGDLVIPTVWASAGTIRQGVRPSGFDPAEPTPSWPAQVARVAADALAAAEAAQAEVDAWEEAAGTWTAGTRVTSLDATELAVAGSTVEAMGAPAYVADVATLAEYGVTETGWYVLARIAAPSGVAVTEATAVAGADGSIVTAGADHVDVAVRFDVAAMAKAVAVAWDEGHLDAFVFRATDLAVRNLDYRTTFYVYDIADYVTWEFAAATDATFDGAKHYYTLSEDGTYELAEPGSYVIGDPVPADTYYVHSKATFSGMVRNVTYQCSTPIDCPSEFVLPEVEDETHGCWFEIRFLHDGSYSSTLTPPSGDVKVATEHTQSETKGINMVDLHYTSVGGAKVWRFMNTHSTFTPATSPLDSIEFRAAPTKSAYAVGEALDTAGAEVVATYADGTRKLVTPTYDPASGAALAAGDTTLTASYTEGGVTATATTPLTITGGD